MKDESARSASDSRKSGDNIPIGKFVNPGILLFIDQLLMAAGNWFFWIIVSRFTTSSEIGNATTLYSLVLLTNTILQLGFEYPLLKRDEKRSQVFGTTLVMELVLTIISIPIIFLIGNNLYHESQQLMLWAIGILVLSSIIFIARFALLSVSNVKAILILDIAGVITKFVVGFALVSGGYGATGILISLSIQTSISAIGFILISKKLLGLSIGNFAFGRSILRESIVNIPTKMSNMLVVSLSVVLLAFFGLSSEEVGVFYIAIMVSIVAGSFASSLAFMSIPASSSLKTDLSLGSLRLSLIVTAPIVAILITAPDLVLSLIGNDYTNASGPLIILAAAVLPSAILSNATSRYNNLTKYKELLTLGAMRIVIFLLAFFVLVPIYGITGAAYSIFLSFGTAAILPIVWARETSKYLAIAICAIIFGVTVGYTERALISNNFFLVIPSTLIVSFGTGIALRGTSIKELSTIVRAIR